MGVVGFGAFTRQSAVPDAVLEFSPAGERLAVITEVANPLATWREIAPSTSACAYRLCSLLPDGSASDWSKTSYVR